MSISLLNMPLTIDPLHLPYNPTFLPIVAEPYFGNYEKPK